MKKLYDIEHPYYGTGSGQVEKCSDWSEFMNEWGGADPGRNFLYRWDWPKPENPSEDVYYRDGTLTLFYILQRKGYIMKVEAQVCKADEPKVKAFLEKAWLSVKALWVPIGNGK